MLVHSYSILALLLLLAAAVVMDAKFNRIPNWITSVILAAGMCTQVLSAGLYGIATAFSGAILGLICFLPFYIGGGMSAGDVKLLSAIGSFLGIKLTLITAAYTLVVGGLMALVVALCCGNVYSLLLRYAQMTKVFLTTRQLVYLPASEDDPGNTRFAYALAIATGTCIVLYQYDFLGELPTAMYGG